MMKHGTKKHRILPIFSAVIALALAACSTLPERIEIVEEARVAVNEVDSQPKAERIAGAELAEAKQALRRADNLIDNNGELEDIRHQAYLALRHANIVSERIAEAEARAAIDRSEAERNRVLLQARENEADRAKLLAAQREQKAARAEALAALREQDAQRAEALAAQREMEAQRAETLAAQREQEAELAKSVAAERTLEAEQKAQEAALANARAEASMAEQRRLEAALLEMEAKKTPRGYVLTLGDVLFDTDKAELKPGAHTTMDRLSEFMSEHPEHRLIIEGHTDSRGSEEYNEALSQRRANAVRVALIDRGVAPDRLQVTGQGENFPVATNDTAAGRQQNRRVEIVVSDNEGEFPAAASR